MRTRASLLLPLALLVAAAGAGAQQVDGARDSLYHRFLAAPSLVRGGVVQARWMADGNTFWYAEGMPDSTAIYRVDPKANTVAPMFDAARVRRALAPLLGREPPYHGLPFDDFTFADSTERRVRFTVEGRPFVLDRESYAVTPLPTLSPVERERLTPQRVRRGRLAGLPDVYELRSPDGRWLAGVESHDLRVRSTWDGRSVVLADDGEPDHAWDVYGAKWAPNSLRLAALKVDERQMPRFPIAHWLKPSPEIEWIRLPLAGAPTAQAELWVVDVMSGRRVRIDTGDQPDAAIGIVGWRADGSEVLFTRGERGWKRVELRAADPATGKSRLVLAETESTFVNPTSPVFGLPGYLPLADGRRFVWMSERDGWNHLYLYDWSGALVRRLTTGAWPVTGVVAVDEKDGWVYFTAHGDPKRPYDTHLYRVDLTGKRLARLTEAPGQHSLPFYLSFLGAVRGEGIQFSPSREFFLDTHSDIDRAPATELRRADGTLVRVISRANTAALASIGWTPPEPFVVKAADGQTDLYGLLWKPRDFEPARKYPVLEHIYAGPQTTTVPRTFTAGAAAQAAAMAQLGFIVVMVDGRGTPERGKAFQDVVYGNFGRHEIADHAATLKQLAATRPFMDMTRVGVRGGSFGGYFTVRALLQAPEVYHVGVAVNPVYDLYETNAGEGYIGTPQQNPEAYAYASSLRLADRLRGKLLLVHGTSDVNAPFPQTMKFIEALTRAGKPYDLILLPGQHHWFHGQGDAYVDERERQYLVEHLRP